MGGRSIETRFIEMNAKPKEPEMSGEEIVLSTISKLQLKVV